MCFIKQNTLCLFFYLYVVQSQKLIVQLIINKKETYFGTKLFSNDVNYRMDYSIINGNSVDI